MNLNWRLVLFAVISLLSVPAFTQAAAEFSADTVESHPQYGERKGRLYMGHGKIRTDFEVGGQQYIQILDLDKQQAIIINPAEKSYMRRQGGGAEMQNAAPSASANPCANMQNLVCTDGGIESVNGRRTHKWVISRTGQSGQMTFWLDEQRNIPVRQEMPDGTTMEMHMVGNELVNGRKTEKWELSTHRPNGESQTSFQWYDPELNTNIREQQADGSTRNLTNIRLGKQPDNLFSVPAGYTEQAMPQQPQQ